MATHPHTNFVLPGRLLNRKSQLKCAFATAYAYSRAMNPRNLECHWYSLWATILQDLTADHGRLLVLPQHLIAYPKVTQTLITASESTREASDEGEGDSDEGEGDSDEGEGDSDEGEGDSDEGEGDSDEGKDGLHGMLAADTSFTTAVSATFTVPGRSDCRVPDFGVGRVAWRTREPRTMGWRGIKIRYAAFPILAEVKRAGKRDVDFGIYGSNETQLCLERAERDAYEQAKYLFEAYPRQQSVVLIAISANWWRYRVATRQFIEELDIIKDLEEEDVEEDDGEEDSDEEDGGVEKDEDIESDDELDLLRDPGPELPVEPRQWPNKSKNGPLRPFRPQTLLEASQLILRENEWSDSLRLEGRASNQAFYLIHRRLGQVLADRTGRMG